MRTLTDFHGRRWTPLQGRCRGLEYICAHRESRVMCTARRKKTGLNGSQLAIAGSIAATASSAAWRESMRQP